ARAVAAADPTAATRREITAHADRRVILTPRPDGMCEFWALLSAPDAMALWTAVTAMADRARAAEHAAHNNTAQNGTADQDDTPAEDDAPGQDDTPGQDDNPGQDDTPGETGAAG